MSVYGAFVCGSVNVCVCECVCVCGAWLCGSVGGALMCGSVSVCVWCMGVLSDPLGTSSTLYHCQTR